ncbi:MAG: NADH-quinone oxidoreductase subunit N, partial [Verrucomicrobiota bacterium]
MTHFNYVEVLQLAGPETILTLAALAVLGADLLFMRDDPARYRRMVCAAFAGVGCVGAGLFLFAAHAHGVVSNGMLVLDPLTTIVKLALLVLTLFTVMISIDSDFTTHVGEYFALILMAAVGMLFMAGAEEILMIFVALELTSISLYVLGGFNKQDVKSSEAALKYFLVGGLSAAFTLYGLSLIYGLSGSTNLRDIAAALQGRGLDPLLIVALVMTVIGFGFKIAAVPFHLWAPDAYEGAPTPSAALIASGSKVASFFLLAKVMMLGFAGVEGSGAWRAYVPGWVPTLGALAALSMVMGNLAAIVQGSFKRLLAYSAIAHAGYMLLGVMSHDERGMASLVYYVATYGLATIGAFGVVAVLQERGGGDKLTDFAGLCQRAPRLALYL